MDDDASDSVAETVEDENGWKTLGGFASVPKHMHPIAINSTEFICVTESDLRSSRGFKGLALYNTKTKTWSNPMKDVSDASRLSGSVSIFNKSNNTVYLFGRDGTKKKLKNALVLFSIDLSTLTPKLLCTMPWDDCYDLARPFHLAVVGNTIHSFLWFRMRTAKTDYQNEVSYEFHHCHMTLDLDKVGASEGQVEWVTVAKFDPECRLSGSQLIHLSRKNKFLILGGDSDAIYELDLDAFVRDEGGKQAKWVKSEDFKMPLPWKQFSSVVTQDEKFVVAMCGHSVNQWVTYMYVLNLNSMVWSKIDEKVAVPPNVTPDNFVYCGSPLCVVMGYRKEEMDIVVRGLIRRVDADLFVPDALVQIMANMCGSEHMHVLMSGSKYNKQKNHHFRLNLDVLLSNVQ